jgi:hypothetical protein
VIIIFYLFKVNNGNIIVQTLVHVYLMECLYQLNYAHEDNLYYYLINSFNNKYIIKFLNLEI